MGTVGTVVALIGTLVAVDAAGAADAPPVSASAIPATPPPRPAHAQRWTALEARQFWTKERMAEAKPLPDAKPTRARKVSHPRLHGAVQRPNAGGPHTQDLREVPMDTAPTDTPTPSAAPTPTDTSTPEPSATPTDTPSPTATDTSSASPSPTDSASPTPSPSPSPTGSTGTSATSSYFGGLPMVGRMYMQTSSGYYFCTASVINSPHHDIVLTAGHCMDSRAGGGSMAFVPQWTAANPQPYGVFPIATDSEGRSRVWIDPRYYDRGHVQGAPWDVAFVQLGARSDGKQVQDVVGGNNLATGRGYVFPNVTLVGYPGNDPQPLTCTTATTQFTPTDGTPGSYLQIACSDYRVGTSGGPFLADFNPQTGTGDVVGSIGGWDTGGPTADISYSSLYDADIQNLYNAAVAGSAPARPNVLPSASTMTHATLMASGYFTPSPSPDPDKSDLIVRWSDGELTLYRGAGNGRFDKEIQLAASNTTWTKAVSMTAGDFTGSNTYDLMVRWTDGSLTLFPDVDATGLHQQITLVKPGTMWQHEVAMTAGRYTTDDHWPDDLIVRWSDGETTLYKDISASGAHGEAQLNPPNSLWTHATTLATGDFAGSNESDLVVRWSDGELTLYPDVDQNGFHGEVRLRAPSTLWTNATVAVAGNFTSTDNWPDDYLVRWSDGQVSMYQDTGTTLGTESVLVAASNSTLPYNRR
ncbi:hypothetical protein ACFOSC_15120 [Streptantibioticus rubrisoli]|uniref:Peptidase S1 domain-containing protein n=1 Tax=Streptantibioticus rubrisoli TaxID=1387313 RepID=A0ABT1P9I3_9ACTN|nr:hypothetical protein [Streptantibioticus rubrisoli]MCQ4042022.1 hypothetical protein [Streptantibioticus rubrisoli]